MNKQNDIDILHVRKSYNRKIQVIANILYPLAAGLQQIHYSNWKQSISERAKVHEYKY